MTANSDNTRYQREPISEAAQQAMRRRAKARFEIIKDKCYLLLKYSPLHGASFIDEFISAAREEETQRNSSAFPTDCLNSHLNHDDHDSPYLRIASGTFCFYPADILDPLAEDKRSRTFRLGTLKDGQYYVIPKFVLGLKNDLRLHVSVEVDVLFFLTPVHNLPILQWIDKIVSEPIIVGGDAPGAIDQERFVAALRSVPTRNELQRYVRYRVEKVVQDFFESTSDEEAKYQKYLARHIKHPDGNPPKSFRKIYEQELHKYAFLHSELENMLNKPDVSESDWQQKILKFILLLFPRYIHVLNRIQILEKVSCPKGKFRIFDLVLVDIEGHIDLIEIKKPFDEGVLRRGTYRDNYIPARELTGAIMQAEKYIYYLQKGGHACEVGLNNRYSAQLPAGLTLKVVNPKAMIIVGRSNHFDEQQRLDFEIIRRKYANVIDILTYDDLLSRLDRQIQRLQQV